MRIIGHKLIFKNSHFEVGCAFISCDMYTKTKLYDTISYGNETKKNNTYIPWHEFF